MNYTTHRQFTESKLSPARDGGWTCTTSESFSLSVIVPVYNERHLVEVSLRRVLALNHDLITSLQLVAVDDCSTDGSWEVLQRLAADDNRILLLRHERNSGKGAAIRTALQHATGEIASFTMPILNITPAIFLLCWCRLPWKAPTPSSAPVIFLLRIGEH